MRSSERCTYGMVPCIGLGRKADVSAGILAGQQSQCLLLRPADVWERGELPQVDSRWGAPRRRFLKPMPNADIAASHRGRLPGVVSTDNRVGSGIMRAVEQGDSSHVYTNEIKGRISLRLRIVKPIRQHHRCTQSPPKDAIAYPRADNLHPTRPVRATDRHKVALFYLVIAANVLRQ